MKFEKIHVINKISEFISGWLWFNLWRGITVDHRVFYFYIFFCIFSLHMLFTASYSLSSSRDWIEFREPTLINFFSSNKWNCLSTNANQLKLIDLFSQRKKTSRKCLLEYFHSQTAHTRNVRGKMRNVLKVWKIRREMNVECDWWWKFI